MTKCRYFQIHPRTGERINECEREAVKGWTTCKRHHSAGHSHQEDRPMTTYTRFTDKAPNAHAILLGTAESAINDPKYTERWTPKQRKAAAKRIEEMRRVGRENGWND